MSFANKVVIITGAGSGMGEAIAIHFAKLSARLSLMDINWENLNKVVQQCEALSKTKVLKLVVDIAKDDDLKQAVDKTIKEYGRIDVVVNCAGIFNNNGILDSDVMSVFDRVMDVNLRSTVAITHYTAAALIESKGSVINIASVMARVIAKGCLSYSVSKAGLVHFTKSVALELADKGVRVNCILPGPVNTNILLHAGYSREERNGVFAHFLRTAPLPNKIKLEEIANMVEYLASDKASSVTGGEFVIDSGYLLAGNTSSVKD